MYVLLFNIAGLATAGWLLMILLPGWSFTKALVRWSFFPIALALTYVVGVVAYVAQNGPGMISDFGSPEGVVGLLSVPDVALIAWIHILAFDHLVGVLLFRDNLRHRVMPLPLQSIVLLLTLMFGPAGFLAWTGIRAARGHGVGLLGERES